MSTLHASLVSSEWRRSADVVSMLVGIYGTRELFVNEYRSLLAHRLLYTSDMDELKETRHLHVLRARLTGNDLDQCDVMLHDMKVHGLLKGRAGYCRGVRVTVGVR